MIIAHNTSAINTYNQMGKVSTESNKSMEKLSSGYKINRAADDAAGLSISEKMRSQIRGLNKAGENVEQGISMIQTAEGALAESHSILQRMRELAVQAANDTNATSDREALQSEINQLTCEINRIANTTEFNGMNMLDGSKIHLTGKENIDVAMAGSISLGKNFGAKNGCNLILAENIKFDPAIKPYGIDYTSINPKEDTNLITFSKKDGRLYLDIHIESADGNTSLNVENFELMADNKGNYSYHEYGISFALDKESTDRFLREGDESTKTVIDLYKVGVMEEAPTGCVSGKELKTFYADWVKNASSSDYICFNYISSKFMHLYKDKVTVDSTVYSVEEILNDMPDNVVLKETYVTGGDFHYHLNSSKQNLGMDISKNKIPNGIDIVNYYEDDSSSLGSISNFNLKSYDDSNSVQQRLDYNKVEIEFQNASDSYITINDGAPKFYRKISGGNVPLTVINYKDHFNVDASGNVTIVPGSELYVTGSDTPIPDEDILAAVTGHGPEKAHLNVKFYNGSDVVVEDVIEYYGMGDIKDTTSLSYNANGVSFDVILENLFDSNDKVHAILDVDKEFGVVSHVGNGKESDNSVYFHVGANSNQFINTEFSDMRARNLGLTGFGKYYTKNATVTNGTDKNEIENALNISTREGANNAIEVIDKAIQKVSDERSKYGSIQNRLEYTLNNLNTTSENMTNAESTIRDVDMAEEMMDLTKNNIISQASQAMLTQAMQRPQQVLQLLK